MRRGPTCTAHPGQRAAWTCSQCARRLCPEETVRAARCTSADGPSSSGPMPAVSINWHFTAQEVAYILDDCDAEIAVVDAAAAEMIDELVLNINVGDVALNPGGGGEEFIHRLFDLVERVGDRGTCLPAGCWSSQRDRARLAVGDGSGDCRLGRSLRRKPDYTRYTS